MKRTGYSYHLNGVKIKQVRIMIQTESNRGLNWAKTLVEYDQIMRRTRSIESKRVESQVKQGQVVG